MMIPNYIDEKPIDKDGQWTPMWKIIMQQLIQQLQLNASNEGIVAPTQSSVAYSPPRIPTDDINAISVHKNQQGQYTCQFGTLLYDSNTNHLLVALNAAGVPTFKTVTTS